jgi:hypothetical protein
MSAVVQESVFNGTLKATTCVMASLPAAGNVYVVCAEYNGNPSISGITGGGATWSLIIRTVSASSNCATEVWISSPTTGAAGSDSIVVTRTAYNGTYQNSYNILEAAGYASTGPFAGAAHTVATTVNSGNITPTAGQLALLIGVAGGQVTAGPRSLSPGTIPAGWTLLTPGTQSAGAMAGYLDVSSTSGSYAFAITGATGSGYPGGVGLPNTADIVALYLSGGAPALILPDARRGTQSLSRGRRGSQSLLGR